MIRALGCHPSRQSAATHRHFLSGSVGNLNISISLLQRFVQQQLDGMLKSLKISCPTKMTDTEFHVIFNDVIKINATP